MPISSPLQPPRFRLLTLLSVLYKVPISYWRNILNCPHNNQHYQVYSFYLILNQLLKRFPAFTQSDGSQKPGINSYSEQNAVCTFPTVFFNTKFNIILSYTPKSFNSYFPFTFPDKILYAFLTSSMGATCRAHLIVLNSDILIIFS
jgi:hypothetical protein